MDLANASIAQVLIPTHDLERAIAFYRDQLGLPFLFSAPPQMAFFQCGAVRLLVGVPTDSSIDHPFAGLYFKVADIQLAYDTMHGRGVEFGVQPHVVHRMPNAELWLAEFKDPDGNALALMSEVAIAK